MKTKNKNILKKMLSFILTIIMILCSVPMTSFASGMNLGQQNNNAEIDITVFKAYGHELHKTVVNGQTYPLFCIEYGKKSPSVSSLGYQGRPADATSLEAAEWIFAGYYMVHGNDIDELDMAYAQKKMWEITGNNTSWTFSDAGYRAWCEQAENNMRNIETKPSFDGTNIDNFLAGKTYKISDSNGVLKDYPAFKQDKNDGIIIIHEANSNELVITISKNCSKTFFTFDEIVYKQMTGDDANCLIYNAKTGGTQKLLYSAYYDPVDLYFEGNITPLGKAEITKQDHWGASVNGAKFGLYTDAGCTNKVAEATSNGGKVVFEYLEPKEYFVKELSAPQGYLLNEKIVRLNVESNKTATSTVVNDEPRGVITLTKELDTSKTNGKYGDVKITEATYTLKAKTDIKSKADSHTFYKAGEVISTKHIVNNDGYTGTITWEGLPLGEYTVYEENEPYGTFKDTNKYDVTLSYEGQTKPVVINDKTKSPETLKSMKVKIYKTGTNGDNVLLDGVKGAEFTIKLKADYENALAQGYTYEEIWAFKNTKGQWEVDGKAVNVSDERVAKANDIAPSYDVITTDDDGNAVSTYLPFSWYVCKETKTPKDYETCKDFYFQIKNDESEVSVEQKVKLLVPNNTPFEAPVKIYKEDADSGKLVTLSSTTFKIRATENIYDTSTGKIKLAKGEYAKAKVGSSWYDEFMTNSDGYVVPATKTTYASTNDEKGTVTTPFKLSAGKYEVVEIKTADGFLIPSGNMPFVITNVVGNDKDADGDVIIPVTIKNTQPKGKLVINKSFELRENMDLSLINEIDYTKVAFELKAADNIYDKADGSIVYNKDDIIGTYYLDKNGKLEINDLWIGEYSFKEVATIDGAVLDDTVYSVKYEVKDNTTKVYAKSFDIVNYTTEVDITKTDITGEKEVEGAELTIVDKDNNIIDEWISTTESHKIEGLKVNETYTLVEEIASNGFVTANSIEFTVTNTAEIQQVVMKDKIVQITKTDINSKVIKGAELVITNDKTKQIVDKWITGQHLFDMTDEMKSDLTVGKTVSDLFINEDDSTVKYVITPIKDSDNYFLMLQSDGITDYYIIDINGDETIHLARGLVEDNNYTLTEISTPDKFVTATPIKFNVTSEKENQLVNMIDKQVKISKVDVTTGKELPGAELTVTDTEGNVIEKWTSTEEIHIVTGLEEGKTYVLTEVTAPYGFEVAESIEFTVSTDKQTQKVVMHDDYIYSSVRVVKCDITTKKPIVSNEFEFSIYADKECKELISTSGANKDEGTALFEKLKYGTYFIAETKAPLGYSLSDQVVEIVINENGVTADGVSLEESDGVYSFEYYDELLPIINTGDVNNTVKLAVMGGLLVVFIAVFVLVSKKMKKNNK